jgi:hypothetical protein
LSELVFALAVAPRPPGMINSVFSVARVGFRFDRVTLS